MIESLAIGVSSEEYKHLYEKFILANKLFDERDELNRKQLQSLQTEVTSLRHKCQQYRDVIKKQRSFREAFDSDVQQLTRAADMLEQREREVELKNKILANSNAELSESLDKKNLEIQKLQHQIDEKMVPVTELKDIVDRYEKLKLRFERDTAPLEDYTSLSERFEKLKLKFQNNTVPLEEHNELLERFDKLRLKLQNESVSLDEHNATRQWLKEALDEKKLIEETMRFFDEERHASALAAKEADSKVCVFKNRADAVEVELRDSLGREVELQETASILKQDLVAVEAEMQQLTSRVVSLESEKAALLTQLGTTKIAHRKEADTARCKAQETWVLSKENASLKSKISELEHDLERVELQGMVEVRQLKGNLSDKAALMAQAELATLAAVQQLKLTESMHSERIKAIEDTHNQLMCNLTEQLSSSRADMESFRQLLLNDPLITDDSMLDAYHSGSRSSSGQLQQASDEAACSAMDQGPVEIPSAGTMSASPMISKRAAPFIETSPPELSRSPLALSPHPSSLKKV